MDLGGYYCGAIGDLTGLHAGYYHRNWGFDLSFESQVARELAAFLTGMDPARDLFLAARQDGKLAGAVAIDGQHPDGPRLRWFIVDPAYQGQGLGRRLIERAVEFCREAGHQNLHLWTFEGLNAARALYESVGFVLSEERQSDKWGAAPNEQRFDLNL